MNQDFYIYDILKSKNTVFTANELALLWTESNMKNLYERLRYYKNSGKLIQIKKGFYAKDKEYNRWEFANKLYKPSYISLNTVLRREGLTFQYYESIFLCSYLSRELRVDNQNYIYKKIHNDILLNPKGLDRENFYTVASKERAFLDSIYLYKDYYIDNLSSINWDICFDLIEIYFNKAMLARLNSYYRDYKQSLRRS